MLGLLIDWFRSLWSEPQIQWVAFLNALLAWAAGVIHIWAAVKTSGWLRTMFITIASLALFYSLAYWWLFFNPLRGGEWSQFLRPVGFATWGFAWMVEPVILIRYLQRVSDNIVSQAKKAAARTEAKLPDE